MTENRNIAHEATAHALNSEGSAMRENAAYMESYEARINLMKTAWQEFSLAMGDAIIGDTIIALTNSLTDLANITTFVVDKFGLFPPILLAVGMASAGLSGKFRETVISMVTMGKGMDALGVSAETAGKRFNNFKKAFVSSLAIGGGFAVLGFALEGLIKLWTSASEKQEEYYSSLRNGIEETKAQISALDSTSKKLEDSNLTLEERNALYDELAKTLPTIISYYDDEGNAVYKQSEAIQELIASERERLRIKKELAALNALDTLNADTKSIRKAQKEIEKLNKQRNQAEAETVAGHYARDFLNQNPELKNIDFDSSSLDEIESYNKKLNELKIELKKIFNDFGANSKNMFSSFTMDGLGDPNEFFNLDKGLSNFENSLLNFNQKMGKARDEFNDVVYQYQDAFRTITSTKLEERDIVLFVRIYIYCFLLMR